MVCNCGRCNGEGPDDNDADVPIKIINTWIKENLGFIKEQTGIEYTGKTPLEFATWLNKYNHLIYDEFETDIIDYYTKQLKDRKDDGP